MNRSSILPGVLTVVLVGVGLAASPRAASSEGAPSWCTPGQQRKADLVLDVDVTLPNAREPIELRLSGEWRATPSAVHGDECDVAHDLVDVRAHGAGVGHVSDGDVAAWQKRLAHRFWVTYRRDGAALRVHFAKEVDPTDRNLLQMIVTELQLVRPDRDTDHWTALERDAAGMYMADYQRATPLQIVKRKLTYTSVDAASGAQGDGVAVEIAASGRSFSIDREGRVSDVEGSERTSIALPLGAKSRLETRTRIGLHGVRMGRDPSLIGSLARATVETSAIRTHAPDPAATAAQRDATLLEGWTTEALLSAAQSPSDDGELAERLAALFRRRETAVTAALAIARTRDDARRIVEAFAVAGTDLAMDALATLAHDRAAPEGSRIDALNALAFVRAPTVEAMGIPQDLLDDGSPRVRKGALLSSGALARAGRQAHRAASDEMDRELVARYAAAEDDAARIELLSALANSAGPLVLPALEAALRSDRPEVRAAAASALRLAEGPAVDEWLAGVITSDADARVRSAGIFAASFRPIGPLAAALEDAAARDPVDGVRRAARAVLRRAHH